MISKYNWLGILLLALAVTPLLADASGRKRPASVHLKPPVKMPALKKAARPPERRKSDASMTKVPPGAISQPPPAYGPNAKIATVTPSAPITKPVPTNSVGPSAPTGLPSAAPKKSRFGSISKLTGLVKQVSLRKFGKHAYASMKSIFIGPTQQKYLPHEAWHVVQKSGS